MNKTQILAAVRKLATDLRELGHSPVTKGSAAKLLRSDSGAKGGPLVEWLNAESNAERKLLLREVVACTVKAGYQQASDAKQAAETLDSRCKRLAIRKRSEDKPITVWMDRNLHRYKGHGAQKSAIEDYIMEFEPAQAYMQLRTAYNNDLKRRKKPG